MALSFRPLTGIVQRNNTHLTVAQLSPPYGDCTGYSDRVNRRQEFSPPYGDSIFDEPDVAFYPEFSSPYGDCTDIDEQLVRDMGLSPPYGDGITNNH